MKRKKNLKLTNYCITIPAKDVKEPNFPLYFANKIEKFNQIYICKIKYFITGFEIAKGEGGYRHYQSYIQLDTQARVKQIQKIFPECGKFHIEQQMGTNEQARGYCWKGQFEDSPTKWAQPSSITYEFGEFCKGQGFNRPLHKIKKLIDDGQTHYEIVQDIQNFKCYGQYHSWFYKYKHMVDEKVFNQPRKPLKNNVIFGDGGVGKTKSILIKEGYENCYRLQNPKKDNKNWNGYNGQKVLIIDDFYGWLPLSEMMDITDNNPYRVRQLGGYSFARWEKVYITSNKHPEDWWPNICWDEKNLPVLNAFYSRLTNCLEVKRGNTNKLSSRFIDFGIKSRHSYTEYLNLDDYEQFKDSNKSVIERCTTGISVTKDEIKDKMTRGISSY